LTLSVLFLYNSPRIFAQIGLCVGLQCMIQGRVRTSMKSQVRWWRTRLPKVTHG